MLRLTRAGVAWQAVGCACGAYEHAPAYAKERQQFGKPIGGFQLVQDLLARCSATSPPRPACAPGWPSCRRRAGRGRRALGPGQGVLHGAYAGDRRLCREPLGGNGILLEYQVGRFVADAEAIYSYEGTREINTLIVGRAITGQRLRLRPAAGASASQRQVLVPGSNHPSA